MVYFLKIEIFGICFGDSNTEGIDIDKLAATGNLLLWHRLFLANRLLNLMIYLLVDNFSRFVIYLFVHFKDRLSGVAATAE